MEWKNHPFLFLCLSCQIESKLDPLQSFFTRTTLAYTSLVAYLPSIAFLHFASSSQWHRDLCLSSPIRRPLAEREIEDQERYKEQVSTPLQEDWLLSTSSFSSSDSSYTITWGIEVELTFFPLNRTSRKIDHSWVWALLQFTKISSLKFQGVDQEMLPESWSLRVWDQCSEWWWVWLFRGQLSGTAIGLLAKSQSYPLIHSFLQARYEVTGSIGPG